jgi:hypothetical protein
MKITPLKEWIEGHRSLTGAAEVLNVPKQNLSFALNKVKGMTYVLEEDDGTLRLLREVAKRGA